MKIVSWNVNGLLACMEKGGFFPIARMQPDVVCSKRSRRTSSRRCCPDTAI